MSGEGSSSRAGKKRRGPTPRQQGDPEEQQHLENPGRRKIKYYANERRLYGRVARLRDHPLLQFELGTREAQKLDTLINSNLLQSKTIDWTLLDQIGQRDRVEALLGDKFMAALCLVAPQYVELTLEFHATFQYKQGNFAQPDAVSFSLGRQVFEMTMAQFAVATQFYTEEEVQTPAFITSLRGVFTKAYDHSLMRDDLIRFWGTISNAPDSGSLVASEIIDPVYRYIHKILTATLVGRGSGENKVNQVDLFCLLCMVEQRPVNLASAMCCSMKRGWRGGPEAAVYMGPYVTRIAESLGVFSKYDPMFLTLGPATCLMGVRELQLGGILSMYEPLSWEPISSGPQGQPPVGSAAAASMQSGLPPRYQRPLRRSEIPAPQYPLQQPRPDPLTLESLYDRMETGFGQIHGYMTEQFGGLRQMQEDHWRRYEMDQRRQEDGMRYMMQNLNMGVPSFFHAPQGGPSGTGGSGLGYQVFEPSEEEDSD